MVYESDEAQEAGEEESEPEEEKVECDEDTGFGLGSPTVYQGKEKTLKLDTTLAKISDANVCVTDFSTITAVKSDGSELPVFMRWDPDNWQMRLVPHSKSEIGTHKVLFTATASDGTTIEQTVSITVKTYLYPQFKSTQGKVTVPLYYDYTYTLPDVVNYNDVSYEIT